MNILFVTDKELSGAITGGHQATVRNYQCLREEYGVNNVQVLTLKYESRDQLKSKFNKWTNLLLRRYHEGVTQRKVTHLLKNASKYDLIFFDNSFFGAVIKKVKQKYPGTKTICFFHNVEADFHKQRFTILKAYKLIRYQNIVFNEKLSAQCSDIVVAFSKRDADLIHDYYKRDVDKIIPVSLKDVFISQRNESNENHKRTTALFIGYFFPPNVKGILWFIKNVMPFVNIRLVVAGKGIGKLKKQLSENKRIEILDYVEDISILLHEADFMIFPLLEGNGMKIKTCEALMYGKNIFGTSESFAGYDLEIDRVGALCNTATEFITAINNFQINPLPKMNQYSRKVFCDKYEFKVICPQFRFI